jgi:hypothetical protein
MRIVAIQVTQVARILGIAYALLGFLVFLQFAFSSAQELTLPFGFVAPLFYLNLNFHLARSGNVLYNILECLATIASYATTGWLTGLGGALCFNFIAKRTGGVEVKYLPRIENKDNAKSVL